MSNAIYPAVRGLGYVTVKTPEFPVIVQSSPSFTETRIQQAQNPRWHFELLYDFLIDNPLKPTAGFSYTDLQVLMGFYLKMGANFDDFLFPDPDDNSVGPALVTQTWQPNFPYALGAIILDGTHAQQVTTAPQGARSGVVTPAWNHAGGTTTDAGLYWPALTWTDLGASAGYPNPRATLQSVADTTDPVSAATVASGGSGFAVGDYLGVSGGGGTGAILSVAAISGGGGTGPITAFNIVSGGSGYTTTAGAALLVLSGAGTGSPTANITATTVNYSLVQRNFGGLFYEDITDLNGPITVYDNGVLKAGGGVDYSLLGPGLSFPGFSSGGKYLKWIVGPPTGPVTATFSFYYRLRFEMSKTAFEKFMNQWWVTGGELSQKSDTIKLVTSRPASV